MINENVGGFSRMSLSEWRQFYRVDIQFHHRLTIITGANGSGKSTILSILEGNLIDGNRDRYLATPVEARKGWGTNFSFSTLFDGLNPFSDSINSDHDNRKPIGRLDLESGHAIKISLPPPSKIEYNLEFSDVAKVTGFKISSHRPAPKYQRVQDIPISGISPDEAFRFFRDSVNNYEVGQSISRGGNRITNPISPLKQTLISFALQGSSNNDVRAVPVLEGLFHEFQFVLRQLLPKEIGFTKLEVRPPEVIVITETGDFPIDGASGGVMSIIQVAWQIFLFKNTKRDKCVVLIDEPENHLHPSLQREFLSRMVEVFDDVQFIVVTHSPFIISSVRESSVYALRHQSDVSSSSESVGVCSTKIDLHKSAGTASQVLDEVLGVSVTMPVWAEKRLKNIVSNYNRNNIDEVRMRELRDELEREGLSDFFPIAISNLLS